MYADDEVDYDYTPHSPGLDHVEQSAAPPPGRPKYLDHLWVLEGQSQVGGGVHTRFPTARNGEPDSGKFPHLLHQLPSRLRGGCKEDFVAGVAFAVTLWDSCNPVIVDMADSSSIKQDQRRRDETKFEYVAVWDNRLLARRALYFLSHFCSY
ncbi:hypothetical protein AeNC1_016591 [Aphanomyces euteiches]|nr:hypothetical protein AeNC1_016591 [Aphanomyces euteiches]